MEKELISQMLYALWQQNVYWKADKFVYNYN